MSDWMDVNVSTIPPWLNRTLQVGDMLLRAGIQTNLSREWIGEETSEMGVGAAVGISVSCGVFLIIGGSAVMIRRYGYVGFSCGSSTFWPHSCL